jgi:hypothetical protein
MFFATGRKHGLPDVDRALELYHLTPTAQNARILATTIIIWASKKGLKPNGDIDSSRSPAVLKQLVTDVGNLPGGGALKNLRFEVALARQSTGSLTTHLISGVIDELNKCKNFACTDVGTFAGDINDRLPQEARMRIYTKGTQLGLATGIPIIPKGRSDEWDPDSLKAAHKRVYDRSAGECTSFANAAAHLLSAHKPLPRMPRIEIVSFRNRRQSPRRNRDGSPMYKKASDGSFTDQPVMESQYVTHVFCVVGRSGDAVDFNALMPNPTTWGDDARIVDCWLGALGYECSFRVLEYPKEGYLANGYLYKEMDSFKGPSAAVGT